MVNSKMTNWIPLAAEDAMIAEILQKYSVGQEVYIENGLGCWLECVITWVSSTKQTFGIIFKDHEFAYNIKYTVHKKGQTKEGVPESSISTTFHPYNPDLP